MECQDLNINLNIIEEKSKELNLSQKTITKAKYLATEYFKKTVKKSTRPEALMPSFLYIAAIITGERRTQAEVGTVFKTSSLTIRKWNAYLDKEFGDEISNEIVRSFDENAVTKDEDIKSRENEISDSNHGRFVFPIIETADKKDKGRNDENIKNIIKEQINMDINAIDHLYCEIELLNEKQIENILEIFPYKNWEVPSSEIADYLSKNGHENPGKILVNAEYDCILTVSSIENDGTVYFDLGLNGEILWDYMDKKRKQEMWDMTYML